MSRFTIRVLPKQLLPPTVDAGEDLSISLPTNQVEIVGSANDQDGAISNIFWNQISGPLATIQGVNQLTTLVSDLNEGAYVFQLTVTDNDGIVASDTMQLTVSAANVAPTAIAGNDLVIELPLNQVQLIGAGTDSDGTIEGYQWSVISKPLGANPTFSPNNQTQNAIIQGLDVPGQYVVQLTVTDNDGAIGVDTFILTVDAISQNPPIINSIGPLRDSTNVYVGDIPGSVDVRNHNQPFNFDVNLTDIDQHDVDVVVELLLGNNVVFTADTNTTNIFNSDGSSVVNIELDAPLLIGNNSNIASYTIRVTLTDVNGLTTSQDYFLGLFDSTNSGTINGGLPSQSTFTPDSFGSCFTTYSGTFVVPAGQTGSLSLTTISGGVVGANGTTLNNVGPGTYNWSVSLENSGMTGVLSQVRIDSSLSQGDSGSLLLSRQPGHSGNWDQDPC